MGSFTKLTKTAPWQSQIRAQASDVVAQTCDGRSVLESTRADGNQLRRRNLSVVSLIPRSS